MQRKSKDAFQGGRRVPTHDPCKQKTPIRKWNTTKLVRATVVKPLVKRLQLPRWDRSASPIALEDGTTAPEIMLFPYMSEPATGSRIPSISTGGAPTKAMMKQIVAASSVGIIRTPNQPTYRRLLVEVTQSQKLDQVDADWRRERVDMIKKDHNLCYQQIMTQRQGTE